MKTCRKCQETKPRDNFSKHPKTKDRLQTVCKTCASIAKKDYYKKNKNRLSKLRKEYYSKNKEKENAQSRQYKKDNPEKIKNLAAEYYRKNRGKILRSARDYRKKNADKRSLSYKKWAEENREKLRAKDSNRRARKLNATPPWLTEEHLLDIRSMYALADKMKKLCGLDYDVDHIVPLQGKNICGLHVPWNLQVLESGLNRAKYNKFDGGW